MINFNNYCYNYVNNKYNVPEIYSKNKDHFNILYDKVNNYQLSFVDNSLQFNKYLLNLNIETSKIFNKVLIFRDFEQSVEIKKKIVKQTQSLYKYYKNFEILDMYSNKLLYQFYNNYPTISYNIGAISGDNINKQLPSNNLLLDDLYVNIFNDHLKEIKYSVLDNIKSNSITINLILDKPTLSKLITQNLVIQNITINNQLAETVSNLLNDEYELINTFINSQLQLINNKTIIEIIQNNIKSYLIYNLIKFGNISEATPIISPSNPLNKTITEFQIEIQNTIVNYYLQTNNSIIESFQFIASQFKTDPLIFINSLKISHSHLVDMLNSNFDYNFDAFRELINSNNINQINMDMLFNYINDKSNYIYSIDLIINTTIQNYLIKHIDVLLSNEYVTNIIVNGILPKLNKLSPNAAKFYFPIVQYVKLIYVKSIYNLLFNEIRNLYMTSIDTLIFNITKEQIGEIIYKTTRSLSIDRLKQNDRLKNFYMSAVSDTIANMFIDKYRIGTL